MVWSRRANKRIPIRKIVKISGMIAMIKDISEKGMHVSVPSLPKKRKIELSLEVEEDTIKVKAIVQWYMRRSILHRNHQLGLLIENPPPEYLRFIKKYF